MTRASTRSLVVVDDAPEMLALLRRVLGRDPRFEYADDGTDGVEAIRLARTLKPDLMLLDVSMPRMDGLTAAAEIRAASPATGVVLYTAHDHPGLAQSAARAGTLGLLTKSTPVEELGDRMLELWARRRARETEGTTAPEDLRQSEERFRLLVEAVEDYAIFMLDPSGIIVSWNSGAERIKGYTASEAIGRHFRMFYPEEKQLSRHPEFELEEALEHGHFEEEGWRVRKDGTLMWANVLITAVRDQDGRHVGFAKVTRDISERRKAQQERERSARDLAALADQRAELLAVTAHELRTPVTVIRGSSHTLSTHWTDLEDVERQELLDTISSSAARLGRLVEDLLTVARLEANSIELKRQFVSLGMVLEDVAARAGVAQSADPPSLELRADPVVQVDRERIAQAVDNLVHNAYRHGRPPVRIGLDVDEGSAQIRVHDSGNGVPSGEQERVFDRFASGSGSSGTGLGLFIVRELARAHGGDAWWQPAGPGGPGFVISLPLDSGVPT